MLSCERGLELDPDSVAARTGPMVPEDQLRPVRKLDTQPRGRAREVPGHQGTEHARVHREEEGRAREGVLGLAGTEFTKERYRFLGGAVPPARNVGTN